MARLLEVLLVLNTVAGPADRLPDVLRAIGQQYRVVSTAPPRLAVVEAEEGQVPALRQAPGVRMVVEGDIPPDLLAELTASERLFAQAWRMQATQAKGERRGEGLPWDAPGFTPPDPPRRP